MDVKKVKVDDEVRRQDLCEELTKLHYERRDSVLSPGEFSIRGSIFDIFPVTYRSPIRLEFQADRVSSIRDFSIDSGKLFTHFDEVFLMPVTEIFRKKVLKQQSYFEAYEPVYERQDLRRGDYVVHFQHGIARFLGLKTIKTREKPEKHLALEFSDKEILYLPLHEPLERFIGGDGYAPRLTRLHTKDWERIKERAQNAVSRVATDLLEIQAKRELHKGFGHPPDHAWQKQFEAEFKFEETPDQKKAILDVKQDMESPQAMDRLLCGDVGYGKTEVAMRAAFKAVAAGKQVAILVPTTVLAEQHYANFRIRVKNFPVTVEVLSRFRSRSQQKGIVESAKKGATDILIGTHRLLSKDIQFKDLGLVIIDEEQRFGVRHKEKLKQFRAVVDVLTLTATPIPRTLYMSVVGVRDMSMIQTPPKNRMPVETFVMEYDEKKIAEAIRREISRKGQVYFVHNRVQSIEKMAEHLRKIMPDLKFGVGHGQMHPEELEMVMKEFVEGRLDCLLSTNIIESGLDIPNANTIIVNRADMFGLADLYQLRGRVGRYHEKRQAYAYFFIPRNWVPTIEAEKRLAAIARFTELGAGFKIALEDLEIRGAGNLLGHEQSGFIHAVGFDLYCRMLKQAVENLKKDKS